MNLHNQFKIREKLLILIISLACVILIYGAFWYYTGQVKKIKVEKHELLETIAKMKIDQITYWLERRVGAANSIKESSYLKEYLPRWLNNKNDTESLRKVQKQLNSFMLNFDLEEIIVASKNGVPEFSLTSESEQLNSITKAAIRESVIKNDIVTTDFYFCNIHSEVHIDYVIPFTDKNDNVICTIVLAINPDHYIFPLIQNWPTPSKTAETIIVEKKGDSVVFLNKLRHINNSHLSFSLPISKMDLPAVKAVSGYRGVFEGKDYRGIKVLSDVRQIPNTNWAMISKVDKQEIYADLELQTIQLIVFILFILITLGLGLSWYYNHKGKTIFEKLFIAEKDLNRTREELQSTIDNMINAFVIYESVLNDKGEYVSFKFGYFNSAYASLFKINYNEVKGKDVFEVLPETNQSFLETYSTVAMTGVNKTFEICHEPTQGVYYCNAYRPGKSPDRICVIFEEITERKKAEQVIKKSEERLNNIIQSTPMGIHMYHLQDDGRLIFEGANNPANKILGVDHSIFIGKTIEEAFPPLIKTEVPDAYRRTALEGIPWQTESIEYNDNKIVGAYEVYAFQISPNRMAAQFHDVTERKKAVDEINRLNEELELRVAERTSQLTEANNELEAFAYSVSHDLRAPLRAIDGFARILTEDYVSKLDNEANRLCNIIMENATHMGQLIDDLLAFSRLSRTEMKFNEVDMKDIVKQALKELLITKQDKKIKIRINELSHVKADHSMIKQVWVNLLSNAIKFSSKKTNPEIIIKSEKSNDEIIFSIKDNGAGFNEKYKNKLFGVFQRLHNQSDFEGSGVGLAIVQRIIGRHGGKIWAEGEPGKGAIFYFSLPEN